MSTVPSNRILVIDDTPSIHDDFRKILCAPAAEHSPLDELASAVFGNSAAAPTPPSFLVDCAQQGSEGLALLQAALAIGHPYSVAFVDMRMPPGWDGLETIVHLWSVDPDLQIVICTAHSDHSWSAITERLGQSDKLLILKKPFDHVEALQLAHALSKKWEITRRQREQLALLDRTVASRTEELRAAKTLFTEAFNASPLALSIQALDDGTIIEINAAHEQIFGIPRDAFVGRNPEQLRDRLDPVKWGEIIAILRRGESVHEQPFDYFAPDGDLRNLRSSARPVTIGGRACAVWAIRDVTDQIHLERKFMQAQKMEAIGQLSAGIAHDFNNLLTVILNYTHFILEDPALATSHRAYLDQVRTAAENAASLTRQLLVFSRRQITKTTSVDLSLTVGNIRPMLTRLVPEHIRLTFDCPPGLPTVLADAANIEHVLMNLVVNARDAVTHDGRIDVRTAATTLTERDATRHPEARPGPHVRLTVSDNGQGIAPDVLPRVFDPFFTTKSAGEGTGLGLSTVYGIVRQHAGWIEVTSALGRGTTFDLYFPAEPGTTTAPATHSPVPAEDTAPRGQGEHILVVEDDRAVRLVATALATRAGYRVTSAEDGPSALAIWENAGGKFDLLLSDVVMPNGFSGLELAQHLRRHAPDLKVILTTGYSDALLKRSVSSLGDTPILLKPYTNESLLTAIRDALDKTPPSDPGHS